MAKEDFWDYSIGDILRVNLKDTYFIHPEDSYIGSEAILSTKPLSNKSDWLGVSVIYGKYAGCRENELKLRMDMLSDMTGKKVLVVPSSQIKDLTDCF